MDAAAEIRRKRREKILKRDAATIHEPNNSVPIIEDVPVVV